jgi:hypothetical protein
VTTDLLGAALEVSALCRKNGFRFCFIGGVAVQRWGNPRFTVDVDLTLLTGYGREEAFVDALLSELLPRRPDARSFAVANRVLLAKTRSGIDVDVALGALPFEQRSVERASPWQLDAASAILTCSAADLIVYKVFAGRDRDWDDVRGILTRQHGRLDWDIVRDELPPLLDLKEEPESWVKLEHLAADVKRLLST